MAGLGNKLKLTVLKGMEAVGQSASNLASNAQQKLQELNLETQRREILSDFPLRAYDLWQKGEKLPEALDKMMKELSELDERLGVLRAQRYVKVEGAADGESAGGGNAADGESTEGGNAADGESTEGGNAADAGDGESAADGETVSADAAGEAMLDDPSDEGMSRQKAADSGDAPMDDGETGDNA